MLSKFIWDPAKARANAREHGVTFEEAVEAFGDANFLELGHEVVEGEFRIKMIAAHGTTLLAIIFAERGAQTRIISVRKATSHEISSYHDANSFEPKGSFRR
jgi:uncharacterized DUF497 family protein